MNTLELFARVEISHPYNNNAAACGTLAAVDGERGKVILDNGDIIWQLLIDIRPA